MTLYERIKERRKKAGDSFWEILVLVNVGMICGSIIRGCAANEIPHVSDSRVQSGYAVPSKLEVQCKDVKGNKQKQTSVNYKGAHYFLKETKDGKLFIVPYEIKAEEVRELGIQEAGK